MLGTELATFDRPVATVGGERRRARGTAPWQTATRRKGKAHSPVADEVPSAVGLAEPLVGSARKYQPVPMGLVGPRGFFFLIVGPRGFFGPCSDWRGQNSVRMKI